MRPPRNLPASAGQPQITDQVIAGRNERPVEAKRLEYEVGEVCSGLSLSHEDLPLTIYCQLDSMVSIAMWRKAGRVSVGGSENCLLRIREPEALTVLEEAEPVGARSRASEAGVAFLTDRR